MPDTVKEIKEIISPDEGPFQNRKILKSVKLSDSLTSLPLQAFAGAESLEYVDLGKGIKEIKEFESLCTESLKIVRFYDNLHLDVKALHKEAVEQRKKRNEEWEQIKAEREREAQERAAQTGETPAEGLFDTLK